MKTIAIPQFAPDTTLDEAFAAMLECGTCGVLEVADPAAAVGRLLEFTALREAGLRGNTRLDQVMAHDRVSMNLPANADVPPPGFGAAAFAAPAIPAAAGQPSLRLAMVLADEAIAQVYTLAPRIRICAGPNHHSHPPNTPNALGNCGLCGHKIR